MCRILHVLLTGGVGSRLWPLSRQSKPKQYLEIFSGKSLFEMAIQRNESFSDGLIVVGNRENRKLSEDILERMHVSNYDIITEAIPRNTAPAICFAAFSSNPEDILLVTPADHLIGQGEAYEEAVQKAIKLAKENYLVTFGVQPTKPETGYGYLEVEGEEVLSFREKPDRKTAEGFLQKGSFLWNSGMFCFRAASFLQELKLYAPKIYDTALEAWSKSENNKLQKSTSLNIPSISVDYAVMEKSNQIKVVPAGFKWSDMGCFEAIYEYLKENGHTLDMNANMQIGDIKPTYFVGLHNCILVSTKDVNLVISKEASQDVKFIYQDLQQTNPELVK